jgi:hypothetical protein
VEVEEKVGFQQRHHGDSELNLSLPQVAVGRVRIANSEDTEDIYAERHPLERVAVVERVSLVAVQEVLLVLEWEEVLERLGKEEMAVVVVQVVAAAVTLLVFQRAETAVEAAAADATVAAVEQETAT